jgi:CHAD domain-containing protein
LAVASYHKPSNPHRDNIVSEIEQKDRIADVGLQPACRPCYNFKAHEKIPHGVKRMVLEQIDWASYCLTTRDGIDAAIHNARVCLKKIRAVLRLVRKEIGDGAFHTENVKFRDAGRRLSGVRDSAVAIDTFDKLTDSAGILLKQELQQLRASLVLTKITAHVEKETAFTEVGSVIRAARAGVEAWQIDHKGFSALAPGLGIVYGDGRATLGVALEQPTVGNLHELRKNVKNLWYQMQVLGPAWLALLEAFSDQLENLAGLLSKHHDLAVLREALAGMPGFRTDDDPWATILVLISQRQRELRMQAMPLAERVYVEKPGAFVRRIEGYWNAWRPGI